MLIYLAPTSTDPGRADDPSEAAPKRTYHSHSTSMKLVEAFVAELGGLHNVTPSDLAELAFRADRSERQVGRIIEAYAFLKAEGLPLDTPRIPEDFLVQVAVWKGNVAAAYRRFDAWPGDHPPISTVYRWLDEVDPGLTTALRKGRAAYERYLEIGGRYEPAARNELWLMDEMHVPVRYRDAHGRAREDLHLHTAFEAFGRLASACQTTVGQSDAAVTAAVFMRAVAGGEIDGVAFGGSPEAIAIDNAKVYESDLFKRALRVAGTNPRRARPYTPQDKALIERWHLTLQEMWLAALPGYLKGPTAFRYESTDKLDRHGKPLRERVERPAMVPSDPALLLTAEELTDAVYRAVYLYNTTHEHGSLAT